MDAVLASPQYEGAGGLEKAKKVCVGGKKESQRSHMIVPSSLYSGVSVREMLLNRR